MINSIKMFGNVLVGEVRRVFADRLSHFGDSVFWIIYTVLMFFTISFILGSISGQSYTKESLLSVMVGWITFRVSISSASRLQKDIQDEGETGTLEQIVIGPTHLLFVFCARGIAYFLFTGIMGIIVGLTLILISVRPFPEIDLPGMGLIFLLTLVGVYGLGFVVAGLSLYAKRINSVTSVIFELMIFLTGAFVGFEAIPWLFNISKIIFPVTWGISLMRNMLGGTTIYQLFQAGELNGFMLHSLIYLIIGIVIFVRGLRITKQQGTLGHY